MSHQYLLSLSSNLRKYRKARGLKQKEIAEAINIDCQHYARVERGERGLSLEALTSVCEFYGITLNDIIQLEPRQEDHAIRQARYEGLCEKMKKCSLIQLALIDGILDTIDSLVD